MIPDHKNDLSPVDVLASEGGDCEIKIMLTLAAGAVTGAMSPQNSVVVATQLGPQPQNQSASAGQEQSRRDRRPKSAYQKMHDFFMKYDRNIKVSEARNALLVMAVLVATATYSAVLSPPGGVWQDDFLPDAKNNASSSNDSSSTKHPPPHTAGEAVMATQSPMSYAAFVLFNWLGFVISLWMMLLLTVGLPLEFELRLAVWALSFTYLFCFAAITPGGVLFMTVLIILKMLLIMILKLTIVLGDYMKERRQSALLRTRVSA